MLPVCLKPLLFLAQRSRQLGLSPTSGHPPILPRREQATRKQDQDSIRAGSWHLEPFALDRGRGDVGGEAIN